MKVNLLRQQAERAMHMSKRTRNAERQARERRDCVVQHDMSLQIFNHARGIVVLLLALSQLTEVVNFFLGCRAVETRRVDSKVSQQIHPFNEASLSRGNQDLHSEVHRSGKSGRVRLGEEAQPVLYPALLFGRVQRNRLTFRVRLLCHFEVRYHRGPPQLHPHRRQRDLSIHSVHNSLELCFQRHGMMALRYLEIGRVGTAFDLDVFENAIEFAGGSERSSDARKHSEVRALKHIGAGKKGLANVLRLQGAELPVRANLSGRLRIQQRSVERQGPVIGHSVQRQFVNCKLERFCSRFARSKLQHGTVGDDLVDNHSGLLRAAGRWRCVPDTFTRG